MASTVASFLARVNAAAATLGEPEISDLVAAVQRQSGAARLRLLVVGAPGAGRFSLVNLLLGQPGLLPATPLPRTQVPVSVRHGAAVAAEVVSREGITTTLPTEKLHAFLTGSDTGADRCHAIDIAAPADLLRTAEIRVEVLESARSLAAWKENLAGIDYALLVLNATALLSEQERRFVREVLQPVFGLQRVAVIVNQMDAVAADERPAVLEHVRGFLGPFESQPALLELAAAPALHGLAEGIAPPDSGYEFLKRLIHEDLLDKHRVIKAASVRQAAEMCLLTLEEGVQRQQALINTSEADLHKLLERLDPQSAWLQARIERVQQRIEAFVNTLTREQFLREVEEFSQTLGEQLPDEVRNVSDVGEIKRHLPGYVEQVWTEFFNYQLATLRTRLDEEIRRIAVIMEEDLKEMLAQAPAELQTVLLHFDPTPASMRAFMMPSRGNHPVGTMATWMQVGGLFLLLVNPQISLALLGGGQLVRIFFQQPIKSADKEAIIAALTETTYDLERQLKQQITQRFGNLSDELKQSAAEAYTRSVERMRVVMEEQIGRQADLVARKAEIEHLSAETVPALRQEFARLIEELA